MTKIELKVLQMLKDIKNGTDSMDEFDNETIKKAASLQFIHPKLRFSSGYLVVTKKGEEFVKGNS